MRRSRLICFLLIPFLALACNEQGTNQRNKEAFKEELKSRELKRATEAEISNAAYQQGSRIADIAQGLINKNLKSNDSVMLLLKHYKEVLLTISDSLAPKEHVEIQRIGSRDNEQLDTLEALILDAYLYNVEQKLPVEDNIQEIGKEFYLYTRPIVINDKTCLRCHGEIGQDILDADAESLIQKHPQIPIGHKQGDFIGMWSIQMNRKAIIRAM